MRTNSGNNPEPVGSILRDLLHGLGFVERSGCRCGDWIAKLNRWGVAGVEANRNMVIERLATMAAARGVPFSRLAARIALARAVTIAKGKKGIPAP